MGNAWVVSDTWVDSGCLKQKGRVPLGGCHEAGLSILATSRDQGR